MNPVISLKTDDPVMEKAFRIALGDYFGNIQPWKGELKASPVPCILAGLEYDKPWTRDASLNSWFAGSLITPEIAKNTLMSVLTEDEWGRRIGGQYWDAIIWATAAWNHYLCTGDREFLTIAFESTKNSLHYFELTEFDREDGLFRGGACFQDGISGYPDRYADGPGSGIFQWVEAHTEEKCETGFGLPMKTLSANCLYYNAYRILPHMAGELDLGADESWKTKARALKTEINRNFWNPGTGRYRYLIDNDASDDPERHEGFGNSFSILFGIADHEQCASILRNQYITPQGIPCLWPSYKRYSRNDGNSFGRHSGTIWPQVSTSWAMAASQNLRRDLAWFELKSLAAKAFRDGQFSEIYHPLTGEIYGGLQENPPLFEKPAEWRSCSRQTWCATGYMQMVFSTLLGIQILPSGMSITPWLPPEIKSLELKGLYYGQASLNFYIESSRNHSVLEINGEKRSHFLIPIAVSGEYEIRIILPR